MFAYQATELSRETTARRPTTTRATRAHRSKVLGGAILKATGNGKALAFAAAVAGRHLSSARACWDCLPWDTSVHASRVWAPCWGALRRRQLVTEGAAHG
jgi:hypothetical protein